MSSPIRNVIILGEGYEPLLCAFYLAMRLKPLQPKIQVILTDEVKNRLVYTSPRMRSVHQDLGLDERKFLSATGAGLVYAQAYRKKNQPPSYFSTTQYGQFLEGVSVHHTLAKLAEEKSAIEWDELNLSAQIAKHSRLVWGVDSLPKPHFEIDFGYQIQERKLVEFLSHACSQLEVRINQQALERIEIDNGAVSKVCLQNGEALTADFYLDCSEKGYIRKAQAIDFTTLPSNVFFNETISTQRTKEHSKPFGNIELGDQSILTQYNHDGLEQTSHYTLNSQHIPAYAQEAWVHNSLSLGKAYSNLPSLLFEPEAQLLRPLQRLVELWPTTTSENSTRQAFNQILSFEMTRVFEVTDIHFKSLLSQSLKCSDMATQRINLFESSGRVISRDYDPLTAQQWPYLFLALGITPNSFDPLVDTLDLVKCHDVLSRMKKTINRVIQHAPSYAIRQVR